jgi:hypothetical protein
MIEVSKRDALQLGCGACVIGFCILRLLNVLKQNCDKRLLAASFLSFRMEQLGSHCTDFHEIRYLRIFGKYAEKIQFSLKSDKNNGNFI